jgi:hypothetical protein
VSTYAVYGRVDAYTSVLLTAGGLLQSFDMADDERDHMEGVINEPSVREWSDSDDDEESEALKWHRTREVEANMICADGSEQISAAGSKRTQVEPRKNYKSGEISKVGKQRFEQILHYLMLAIPHI